MVCTTLIPVTTCGSGDINAFPSSTVSDFGVELADALMVDGRWQCRMDSITMANVNHNAGAGVTSNSIVMTLPGVLDGSIIGSTKLPLLCRTGPMLERNTAQRHVHAQAQSPIWRDVQPSIVMCSQRAAERCEHVEVARDVRADKRRRLAGDGPDGAGRKPAELCHHVTGLRNARPA